MNMDKHMYLDNKKNYIESHPGEVRTVPQAASYAHWNKIEKFYNKKIW